MGLPLSGNATVVEWTPTSGTPLTISSDSTDISLTDSYGTQSAAHRAATAATVPGEHTIELTVGFIATTDTGIYKAASVRPTATGNTGAIAIMWEGRTTGGPMETFQGFQTSRNVSSPVNGVVSGELGFSAQSGITYGTVV